MDYRKIWNFVKINCLYDGHSESDASVKVSCASGVILKWNLFQLARRCLSFSLLWGMAW